jgi:predicted dehydrogenase
MKVGIIGNGTHSQRIQKILKSKKINFFLYKPSNKNYYDQKDFEELKKNKIIFILSPNKTHYKYIKKLYRNRFIFCEKPPVNNIVQLRKLSKINYKKIYFNYNMRFSKISNFLSLRHKYNLGKLIYANVVNVHGLALKKKEYLNSWRSNKKKCPKGIFEIVSIHLIDLINYHFEITELGSPTLINHSKIGNSFDTSYISFSLKNEGIVNVFTSYNGPLFRKIDFIFENGTVEQNQDVLIIKGPAINLDKKKFFKEPKIIKRIYLNDKKDYEDSLIKSCNFFLKTAISNSSFKKDIFNYSLQSNKLIF